MTEGYGGPNEPVVNPADKELNSIAVSQRSGHVELGTQLHFVQQDGPDKGSAYFELVCTDCRVVLGKQYQATPRLLDHLREVFTFDLLAISSYQLGSGAQGSPNNDDAPSASFPSVVELKEEINKVCHFHASRFLELSRTPSRLKQIQETLVPLTERLLRLENILGTLLSAAGSGSGGTGEGEDQTATAKENSKGKKKRKSMASTAATDSTALGDMENSLNRANALTPRLH